jgi:hypothetical protein
MFDDVVDSFADFLGDLTSQLADMLATAFDGIADFLAKPLGFLFEFLDGVFYFIIKLYDIAVILLKIFAAFFQLFFVMGDSLVSNVTNFKNWSGTTAYTRFPNYTKTGFDEVLKVIDPMGYLGVIPLIASAIITLFVFYRVIAMIGDPRTDSGSRVIRY